MVGRKERMRKRELSENWGKEGGARENKRCRVRDSGREICRRENRDKRGRRGG